MAALKKSNGRSSIRGQPETASAAWKRAIELSAKFIDKVDSNEEKEQPPPCVIVKCGTKTIDCGVIPTLELLRIGSRIALKQVDGFSLLTAVYPAPCVPQKTSKYDKKICVPEIRPTCDNPPLPVIAGRKLRRLNVKKGLQTPKKSLSIVRGEGEEGILHLFRCLKTFINGRISQAISEAMFIARLQPLGNRLGVGYFGSQPGSFLRMVVVLIELPRDEVQGNVPIGCVRFVTDVCAAG